MSSSAKSCPSSSRRRAAPARSAARPTSSRPAIRSPTCWPTSNGEAALISWGGEASELSIVLTNLDLARAAQLLLKGDEKAAIRCVVADFVAENGRMAAKTLVIDTDAEKILGAGSIDFAKERYDLTLNAQSKRPSLLALRGPIVVDGSFSAPQVHPGGRPDRGARSELARARRAESARRLAAADRHRRQQGRRLPGTDAGGQGKRASAQRPFRHAARRPSCRPSDSAARTAGVGARQRRRLIFGLGQSLIIRSATRGSTWTHYRNTSVDFQPSPPPSRPLAIACDRRCGAGRGLRAAAGARLDRERFAPASALDAPHVDDALERLCVRRHRAQSGRAVPGGAYARLCQSGDQQCDHRCAPAGSPARRRDQRSGRNDAGGLFSQRGGSR